MGIWEEINIKTRFYDFHIISQKKKLDHVIRKQIPIFAITWVEGFFIIYEVRKEILFKVDCYWAGKHVLFFTEPGDSSPY
jgi:hypothetical protein